MKFKLTLVLLLTLTITYSQGLIKGHVTDSITKLPLTFANIKINNTHILSDINGFFSFISSQKNNQLSFSYVGYNNKKIKVEILKSEEINVVLSPFVNTLEEIIIDPKNNPANRIIKNVIENKVFNNPDNINSYQYQSYNKTIYDYKFNDNDKNDSIKIRKKLKGSHFFMLESVTEKKYIKQDLNNETILGTKVSGFKNPTFTTIATDFQPFSFYKDNIVLFDINYLNPISDGSIKKYKYKLEETINIDKDTIFIISFKPLKNKNFDGLKGLLYINSDNYAIQNVIASPFHKGKIDIKIQQKYTKVGGHWFPNELNSNLIFNDYPSPKMPITIDNYSYIKDVQINIPLKKKELSPVSIKFNDNATIQDSLFWKKYRIADLNKVEKNTYKVIDSIGEKKKFDSYLLVIEKIIQNRYPLKYIDVDLLKTLIYNKYEGLRIGTGFFTNERLFKNISFGSFYGYGLMDKKSKFGLELNYNKQIEGFNFNFGIKYQDNLTEVGGYGLSSIDENFYNFRKFIGYRYDRIKQKSFFTNFRSFKYFKWNIILNQANILPQYEITSLSNSMENILNYNTTSVNVNLKFAYKEKFINSFNQNISTGTKYPILNISYSRGFKNVLKSNLNYNKIEVSIEQDLYTRNIGHTKYRVDLGYIDSLLPYGLLFTGEGSYESNTFFIMKNTFQTMKPYEFLSDKYFNLFTSHNFGGLLFKHKEFQPNITLHNNFSIGNLSNNNQNQRIDFKIKDKLFVESGLVIDNILKTNYLNIANLGIGFGAFYRYGVYSSDDFKENLAFKVTLNLTVK